ncbi:peptidoglycan-binding domain-containing protein, partial [Azospirillum rugosum]
MRSIFNVPMPKTPLLPAFVGLALAVGGCGSTDTSRTATGAGGGAVAGAVVGGPVGAVVGGVAGAAGGSTLDEGLGTKADRLTDQGASRVTDAASSPSASQSGSRSAVSTQAPSPERVREVQQALNDRNDGDDIAVDGLWGPNTRQALRRFQQSN